MKYYIQIYEPMETNPQYRFALGTKGKKTLCVFGLNPSTATDTKPDMTISKIIGFALRNNCDSFIMFNLYAQRTTYPNKLHKQINKDLHNQNLHHIQKVIENNKNILFLAAWGETIKIREYFKTCIRDIDNITKTKKVEWRKIGEFTKSGHPRHASRSGYVPLTHFDIDNYVLNL